MTISEIEDKVAAGEMTAAQCFTQMRQHAKRPLDNILEQAAEHLADGWQIEIQVENGGASVAAIRPDWSKVEMWEDETDYEEQYQAAIKLSHDEKASDAILSSNAQAEPRRKEKL